MLGLGMILGLDTILTDLLEMKKKKKSFNKICAEFIL